MKTVFKGFTVPHGYILHINTDSENPKIKYPGEYSGANYTFEQVLNGEVPTWKLTHHTVEVPNIPELHSVMSRLSLRGGTPMFVGGIVRDLVTGRDNKDIDVEVYGLGEDEITDTLSDFGKVDTVGSSFGVIKLTTDENDYDFSLPRRENKAGKGHRGFIVEPDPTMSPREAASRRDYTINSLAMTANGEILDYHGGLDDLKNGILRHTSSQFVEDPLRVLRGFQFAGRFNMQMHQKTADLCRSLRSEYRELPKERVWGEWEKWATKSKVPSAGIKVLEDTGWLELYPELFSLHGVPQDPEYHPEGDVLTHTKFVVDMASEIADRDKLNDRDRTVLIFAALCHDLGKPETTVFKDGRWRAPAHAQEGEVPTISFLKSIGAPQSIIDEVVPLVVEHMAHVSADEVSDRMVRRLANRIAPSNILMLSRVIEADHSGRPPLRKELPVNARRIVEASKRMRMAASKPEPIIGGRELLELARDNLIPPMFSKPGTHFGVFLEYMFNKQLDGAFSGHDDGMEYARSVLTGELQERLISNIDRIRALGKSDRELLAEAALSRGIDASDILEMVDLDELFSSV